MKILVFGATGFIGGAVVDNLLKEHEVFASSPNASGDQRHPKVDLLNIDNIAEVIKRIRPDIIVNCAGVVDNSEKAELNIKFTSNLLEAVKASGVKPMRIIILGSAGEYGVVENLPVDENAPRRANSKYGLSKIKEVDMALEYRSRDNLPVIIARIFNPIGPGMGQRFLINSLIKQVESINNGGAHKIEISRLDSQRDYIDVRDVAKAIRTLIEKDPKEPVYNIGSGQATSNKVLISWLLDHSNLPKDIQLIETLAEPEPNVASQADITRMKRLGWKPEHKLEDTIRDIVHAGR